MDVNHYIHALTLNGHPWKKKTNKKEISPSLGSLQSSASTQISRIVKFE